MGVDAAQVGADQAGRDDRRVGRRHAVGREQAPGERVGGTRLHIDAVD